MRKITKSAAILILVMSLTACTENKVGISDQSNGPCAPNSAALPDTPETDKPLPFTLFGADNVQIDFGEVTSILDRSGEPVSPDKLEDTNWNEITCDGFAYIAARPSIILNSIDNADLYDEEHMLFKDVPGYSDIEYKRYYVGDKLGELTLSSAKTLFSRAEFNDKSGPLTSEQIKAEGLPFSSMLKRCEVSFDGELTMTGYIRVTVDEYGVEDGEVQFAPTDGCPLPVINYYAERERDRVITPLWTREAHGLAYVSEYPIIRLGNIHKDAADIVSIPIDGTSVKVQVTVTDITMFCDVHMSSVIACRIVDIKEV